MPSIPDNPTVYWILASAIVIGGILMSISLRSSFKMAKESIENSNQATGRFVDFCERIGTQYEARLEKIGSQNEATINRICRAHEKVGDNIVREMQEMRVAISARLDVIHEDVKQGCKPA